MRVNVVGLAMGGPACMRNSEVTANICIFGNLLKVRYFTLCLINFQSTIKQRDSGTVVSAVLKPF